MRTRFLALVLVFALTATIGAATVQEQARTVVINEIAWAGTAASYADEWIELKNNTDQDIDLSGWTLSWGDVVIHFSEVADDTKEIRKSIIPKGGFYLLERTDDAPVSDIEADLIYKGSLDNAGELLLLKDNAGKVVDTANIEDGDWPAGTAGDKEPRYATMERIDSKAADADNNWATNDGLTRNGLDAKGNPINGTPKAENSAAKK